MVEVMSLAFAKLSLQVAVRDCAAAGGGIGAGGRLRSSMKCAAVTLIRSPRPGGHWSVKR